ncbi:MAG: SDR family oxidoreductase [Candidatus Kapabacteria bacterium]|jgi:short-subunit dehydrogenase|nr:SDR family oxidoreductase [Candidatus Kapabacteria bacterium]
MNAQGKTIVITGAGNGMGREMALNLVRRGARVAAVDMSAEALQETVRLAGTSGDNISTHVVNITDKASVDALPAAVQAAHGAVDGIINNAGIIQSFVKLNNLPFEAIERVMNVNFYGTLYMIKAFLPHLLERPEAHIVNMSSMGGFLPVPGQTVYGASKAAVKLLTEGLHSELQGTSVGVTVVFPGAIGTNIAQNSGVVGTLNVDASTQKSFPTLPPAEAAEIIIRAMEENRYRVTVGKDARFMDIIYRLHPERAANFIFKKMQSLLS